MTKREAITESLFLIFRGIEGLRNTFKSRQFTIDGRLVGDIGEVIGELDYDIVLDEISQPNHDGTTSDGRRVQVKATFKNRLTFKTIPDYYLGLKLNLDGTYEEIYNGPGNLIADRYSHRKGIGQSLLSFPNTELKELSRNVPENKRIQKKARLATGSSRRRR